MQAGALGGRRHLGGADQEPLGSEEERIGRVTGVQDQARIGRVGYIGPGLDDLLATGGTAEATAKLASLLGAEIAGLGFVVELDFLKGREKLSGHEVHSLVHY